MSTDTPTTTEQLAAMIADLDGYIQRRAEALAEPVVDEQRAVLDRTTAAMTLRIQRAEDLAAELRLQVESLSRTAAGSLAVRQYLRKCQNSGRPLDSVDVRRLLDGEDIR